MDFLLLVMTFQYLDGRLVECLTSCRPGYLNYKCARLFVQPWA